MLRKYLFVLTLVIYAASVKAQAVFTGRVFEDKTRITLQGVIVQNLGNKLRAITGQDGRFSIAAKPGDLLVLKKFSYHPDTLLLTDMHDKEIFLQLESTMLKDVIITDSSGHTANAAKNMRYADPEFHGQTAVYHRDSSGNYNGGITLRLHYFKGDERNKRKAQEKEENREVNEAILKVFTAENIGQYVPLKGKDMDDFIVLYIPDVKTFNSKDFNLLTYLNTCYRQWLKLTPGERESGQIFKE